MHFPSTDGRKQLASSKQSAPPSPPRLLRWLAAYSFSFRSVGFARLEPATGLWLPASGDSQPRDADTELTSHLSLSPLLLLSLLQTAFFCSTPVAACIENFNITAWPACRDYYRGELIIKFRGDFLRSSFFSTFFFF